MCALIYTNQQRQNAQLRYILAQTSTTQCKIEAEAPIS